MPGPVAQPSVTRRSRAGAWTLLLAVVASACGSALASTDGGPSPSAAAARVAAFTCPVAAPAAPPPTAQTHAIGPGTPLRVVTTVAPITSIVASVAGEHAAVVGLIPEGQDSHTYEPKPSVAARLADADLVFVNGLGLEDPVRNLARADLAAGAQLVELGPRTITPDQYLYDDSFPRDGGRPNPHLWTDPPMAACYAQIAAQAMAAADPANAASYAANATQFVAAVDRIDALMRAASATVPAAHRALLTYHDAYAYFAVHYGWRIIGAVQVSSFADPTPKEVAALIRQVEREDVPAIFGSEVFPSPVLAEIARETGVRYVAELRDDDLPGRPGDPEHSYLGLMRFDFVTMIEHLGGDAGALRGVDLGDVAVDRAEYPQ